MTTAAAPTRLSPIVAPPAPPTWDGAEWIGCLGVEAGSPVPSRVHLVGGEGFQHARLLIREGAAPLGFARVPVRDCVAHLDEAVPSPAALLAATDQHRDPRAEPPTPPISVVLCTRDRPELLRAALTSMRDLDYPEWELVVVDNAPRQWPAGEVVAEFEDLPVRLVLAPRAGLSRARNVGVLAASHEVIAFTDDDVVVESGWLRGIALGFAAGEDVHCVCGLVPSCELSTQAQRYFDDRVFWASNCAPAVYSSDRPPADDNLFPLRVARYGTGANFALTRACALEVGGFDEAMGAGSPTGGGEDIDMFVRVLVAGHALAFEPSAVVWHRHRAGSAELREQLRDYGLGLGAWATKLLLQRSTRGLLLRRALPALRHSARITDGPSADPGLADSLKWVERRAILRGVVALLRARAGGASARPLTPAAERTSSRG